MFSLSVHSPIRESVHEHPYHKDTTMILANLHKNFKPTINKEKEDTQNVEEIHFTNCN